MIADCRPRAFSPPDRQNRTVIVPMNRRATTARPS
jgi:hypothetical protein